MQVGSVDTAHGRLPWRVSPPATHAEPEPLIRIYSLQTKKINVSIYPTRATHFIDLNFTNVSLRS